MKSCSVRENKIIAQFLQPFNPSALSPVFKDKDSHGLASHDIGIFK